MATIGVKVKLTMTDKPASTVRFLSYHDQMFIEDFGALVDIHQRSVSFFRGAKSTYGGLEYPEIEELIMKWRREVRVEGRKQMPPEGTLSHFRRGHHMCISIVDLKPMAYRMPPSQRYSRIWGWYAQTSVVKLTQRVSIDSGRESSGRQ